MQLLRILTVAALCAATATAQAQRNSNRVPGAAGDGQYSATAILSDDDPLLAKVILELTQAIKAMTSRVKEQRSGTVALTQALLDCEGCRVAPQPQPTLPPRIPGFCDSDPAPCYPGVHCAEDEDLGYRCGSCPSGLVGDGRSCRRATASCADRPCYPSVQCYDGLNGFRCGPCPVGFDGDGQSCTRRRVCTGKACYGQDGQYVGDGSGNADAHAQRASSYGRRFQEN